MSASSAPPAASGGAGSEDPPRVVEDCLGVVQLLSDGTVTRAADLSALPLVTDVPSDLPVQWKDVVYDATRALRLRMYRPTGEGGSCSDSGGSAEKKKKKKKKKLPVLVYFHGGGFCIGSFDVPNFHAGALRLAVELPALVLSADYRLAPEHRLPAAHEDAESVFAWLRSQARDRDPDPWLAESADFARVYVCGDSAGGNLAHHVAAQHGLGRLDVAPAARLAGCVMLWPYFAGEERTPSEAASSSDAGDFMGTALFDQMWRLALPVGANRDHPAANPFAPGSVSLSEAADFPPALVVDPEKDVLRDRVAEYVRRLKAAGKQVELVVFPGQAHGFFVFDTWSEASDELIRVIRRFVHGSS